MDPITCRLDDATAEEAYLRFRDGVCAGKPRRYAMLYHGGDGLRCKLENSGRCLDPDTPWRLVGLLLQPMFRFDPRMEWVALMPVEGWKQRCDAALEASMAGGRPWALLLADRLAAEMETLPRLVVTR